MRDDVSEVVRVRCVLLHNYAHYAANKLDVWSKAPEWTEYRGHAQFLVIEALGKLLDLNDAIERTVAQIVEYLVLRFLVLLAVNDVCAVATFLIEGSNLASVVY